MYIPKKPKASCRFTGLSCSRNRSERFCARAARSYLTHSRTASRYSSREEFGSIARDFSHCSIAAS